MEEKENKPGTMSVNFNAVRKRAIWSYEDLIEKLNRAVIKNDDQYATPNGEQYTNLRGYVLIDSEDLRKILDNLRSEIGTIGMTYQKEEKEFKDVYSEIFPKEEQSMSIFYDPEIEE